MSDHVVGSVGEARRLPTDRLLASLSGDTVATLDFWWIHVPGSAVMVAHAGSEPTDIASVHALEVMVPEGRDRLDTFTLGVITLADLPGVPPANKRWPWVTHEMVVHTVDTTKKPVSFDDPFPWLLMQPHNLSVQFEVRDDDQARSVARTVVTAIVNGQLPAEIQAYVPERHKMMTLAPLYAVWQDAVDATAEHERTGGTHDEGRPS